MSVSRVIEKVTHGWMGRGWKRMQPCTPRQPFTLQARNIIERLPKQLHASVRRTLRQAWQLDDPDRAERLIRNLARRLEHDAPGVSGSLLEGLDEILTVVRLGLPAELRRSLVACRLSVAGIPWRLPPWQRWSSAAPSWHCASV